MTIESLTFFWSGVFSPLVCKILLANEKITVSILRLMKFFINVMAFYIQNIVRLHKKYEKHHFEESLSSNGNNYHILYVKLHTFYDSNLQMAGWQQKLSWIQTALVLAVSNQIGIRGLTLHLHWDFVNFSDMKKIAKDIFMTFLFSGFLLKIIIKCELHEYDFNFLTCLAIKILKIYYVKLNNSLN